MDTSIKRGSICKFDPTLDISTWSKELRATYKHMRRINAEYYFVLKSTEEGVLCVPVFTDKCSHYVRLVINSNNYYADYTSFLSVQYNWLISEKVHMDTPSGDVSKIYAMHKSRTLNKLEYKRKKEEQKREDKRLRKEIQSLSKGKFPKEQVSSTVAWNMTHPFQGGRTGSK